MDLQFVSKLQTHLAQIGHKNGFAPPTSQDPADKLLHEYFVAETGRSMFDKRRKAALEGLRGLDTTGLIAAEVANAAKTDQGGSVQLFDTAHYSCLLATKAPTETLDQSLLRIELVKAGLSADKIEKAFKAAKKKNKPAETYTVSLKRT